MKVDMLIQRLSKCPRDAEVRLNDRMGAEVLFVLRTTDPDSPVWLEGEHDCNMTSELLAQIEHAVETQADETDFYQNLLQTGITPDMMRRYLGEEQARHMADHCKEHGLL